MRLALIAALTLLAAGCATPSPGPGERDDGIAFQVARVDTDADGSLDAVNVTLLGSLAPIEGSSVRLERDGVPVEPVPLGPNATWEPGRSLVFDCPAGVHEYRLWVGQRLERVMVLECGVASPRSPPLLGARAIDGDGDGRVGTLEVSILEGGPVDPDQLALSMDNRTLRLFANPTKSRLAREPLENGSAAFVPCAPGEQRLETTWRGRPLPGLAVEGCQAFEPGVDAPVRLDAADVDGDGHQDGWHVELGPSEDAPFAIADVEPAWTNGTSPVNGSPRLDPPPPAWEAGARLFTACPGAGDRGFNLTIRDRLVARAFAPCERSPGRPLLELNLTRASGGELSATLAFSRVGALTGANLTSSAGDALETGTWRTGENRTLTCPEGLLVLHYEERLAFRGPVPC